MFALHAKCIKTIEQEMTLTRCKGAMYRLGHQSLFEAISHLASRWPDNGVQKEALPLAPPPPPRSNGMATQLRQSVCSAA